MPTIQSEIDSSIAGVSVFNLALNVAGLIFNKKNVAIYKLKEDGGKEDILGNKLGVIGDKTNVFGSNASIMTAEIREQSTLTEQPLEDGTVQADNKVKIPTEIDIKITLPFLVYKSYIEKIKEYKDNNQSLYIETKFANYKNMQIVGIPVMLNFENINRITFTVRFKEVLEAEKKEKIKMENSSDTNTKDIGLMTGVEVSEVRSA